jgi:hypothetical protein
MGEFLISDTNFSIINMLSTKRTAAIIAAMALLGTVAPAAFAQNTGVNQDSDYTKQANKIAQGQGAANFATAGGSGGDGDDVIAGNNAAAVSFQDQDATATNDNTDDDTFTTDQIDVCAIVLVAFVC